MWYTLLRVLLYHTRANILEIRCNPVDEFHFWLMYINITRCCAHHVNVRNTLIIK